MLINDQVNILLVDDLPEKILALESILEELGQNIIAVSSGRDALRQLLDKEFAVILLDVNMPNMDGFETATLIRQRQRTEHTPIIFITAFGDEMHLARGYHLGAVDYILSPVVPEILRTKVRVFVDLFKKTAQIKRQAEQQVALAREQTARLAAEESTRRAAFLADASTVLSSFLDHDAILGGILPLVVPYLADLCAISQVDDIGRARATELMWADPPHGPFKESYAQGEGLSNQLAERISRVLASGEMEKWEEVRSTPLLHRETATPLCRPDDVPPFPVTAILILPLKARGRTLGAMALAQGPSGRKYHTADILTAEDLASRTAIALDNARLYRDIQESDRRKNEFLAMLAHELRNPLAPIRNAVQILRLHGSENPDLDWARDVIDRQVQQMVRMVDDLLDVSRITQGKIKLQNESVDAASVVARAVEISRPLIDARHHELTVTLSAELIRLEADPTRVAQILSNLLNNAAKYTEEGGRIWLTVSRDETDAIFKVRDTGIGIPPHMLADVFDLFTQVERSLDRSHGGLGIGLTLVRRLVEMHGGTVHASSAGSNKGSEFVVRLPLSRETVPAAVDDLAIKNHVGTNAHCRILVVDDNLDAADSLTLLLRVGGYEVSVAHSGQEALEITQSFQPQVILLDIGLPGIDGYEVARRLRLQPNLQDTVLVALTGYGRDEDRQRFREAGFNRHLVKPVDPDLLFDLFSSLQVPTTG